MCALYELRASRVSAFLLLRAFLERHEEKKTTVLQSSHVGVAGYSAITPSSLVLTPGKET